MSLAALLRAETHRMVVSRITLISLILTLLIGAGMAALVVGAGGDGTFQVETSYAAELPVEDLSVVASDLVQGESWLECADDECLRVSWGPVALTELSEQLEASTGVFVSVLVVAFSLLLVGSDFGSGAVGTQLTFTPSRPRLMAAKSLVAAGASMALMALAHIVSQAILVVAYIAQHGYQEVGALEELVPSVGRAVVVAAILALAASFMVFLSGGPRLATAFTVVIVLVASFASPWRILLEQPDAQLVVYLNPLVAYSTLLSPPAAVPYFDELGATAGEISLNWPVAAALGLGWLVVLGALGCLRFVRQDIKE